ncbi:MAG: DUF433 domain-containing protein [Elusimicrobia bacterium]|nr:DUF433 domain-containing protein [Elusimicrobiota bacterium]
MKNNLLNRITVNPKICHGKPIIKGTRIMVWQILDLLENGCSFDEIIKDYFPRITKKDIRACIHYANSIIKNEEIVFSKELKHAISR